VNGIDLPMAISPRLIHNYNIQVDRRTDTLQGILLKSFSDFKDEPAIGFVDSPDLSYRELKEHVEQQIFRLTRMGIKPGDKIAIVGSNSVNWVISYLSIISMGATSVPVLPDFTEDEISNIIMHSESRIVFVTARLAKRINAAARKSLAGMILLDNLGSFAKDTPDMDLCTIEPFSPEGSLAVDHYEVKADDLASIIYTSGTTGNSKGVMLTHLNLVTNINQCSEIEPLDRGEVFLSILPLSHTLENTVGLLLPIASGALIKYLERPPTAAALVPALKKVRPTYLLSVPMVIEKIFKVQVRSKFNKSPVLRWIYRIPLARKALHRLAGKKLYESFGGRLKFFGIGGAKLDASTDRFLAEARFPYAIGYGLTETSPLAAGDGVKFTRYQSTGRPVKSMEIKINDPDPSTGEGEIWVRGENVMKGYYKEPGLTSMVLTRDGWFKTGDLGYLDRENYLFIKGRLKNVIVGASGENIYPEEIESVINRFRHVLESVVVQREGRLVALVHFNLEELEGQFRHFKEEAIKHIEARKNELLVELRDYVNSQVNTFSRIQAAVVHEVPFEKTATKKIKRYLYE
jgi:long-chain acyl-CoA synthetase